MSELQSPDFDVRARTYDTLRPATVPGGSDSRRSSSSVTSAAGAFSTSGAAPASSRPHSSPRRAPRYGESTRAQEMVAVARAAVPAGVGIRHGSAEQLPFRDGWFDRATMSLVIHLVDRPATFAEVRRVLTPTGRVAIATFHEDHFAHLLAQPLFPLHPGHRRATVPDRGGPTGRARRAPVSDLEYAGSSPRRC